MNVLANGDVAVRVRQAELCAFILRRPLADGQAALAEALRLGVDPLDLCARRFDLGDILVMERAAHWAGVTFAATIPQTIRGSARLHRLDGLANVRALHAEVDGENRYYFSPGIAELLALREMVQRGSLKHRLILTPRSALRQALAEANAPALLVDARQRLARRWPHATAHLDLGKPMRIAFVVALAAIVALTAIAPLLARPLLLPFLLVLIVAPALLRLFATFHRPPAVIDPPLTDAELPHYTVLVPLRDEAGMVPQLFAALGALDYPAEKLDIVFLVESTSPETIAVAEACLHDARFELFVIPDAAPHTKPKALDYVLPLVRGEHVVVFDAEDIPARDQLHRAAERFAAHPEVDCLQAELRIDNGAETWLTALFAGEYAGLFTLLLPWLAKHGLPLPLGGTSNHFRTSALRAVGGWDAFNVTEDADLGVRLARMRSRTGTLAVATAEEAPIRLGAWMRQRTRWMKGWMQTFLVHNRHPVQFRRDIGWRGFVFFQIYVGSLIASSLIHTVFALTVAVQIALFGMGWLRVSDVWDGIYLLVLVIGYGGAFGIALAGLARQGKLDLAVYQLLLPIYWLLHAIAAIRAAVELLTRPYFWSKTRHGETRMVRVVRDGEAGR
jgi:cellulose synthase/poly-beta-1,6-N-acetylglucosamine synthase-like glycosyltransferase